VVHHDHRDEGVRRVERGHVCQRAEAGEADVLGHVQQWHDEPVEAARGRPQTAGRPGHEQPAERDADRHVPSGPAHEAEDGEPRQDAGHRRRGRRNQ
jgi:hypothetical protein